MFDPPPLQVIFRGGSFDPLIHRFPRPCSSSDFLLSWSGEAEYDEEEHAYVDVQREGAVDVLLGRQLHSATAYYHLSVEHQILNTP